MIVIFTSEKLDNSDSDEVEEGGDREDVDPPPGNDVFTKEGDTSTDSTESQVYRSVLYNKCVTLCASPCVCLFVAFLYKSRK